MNEEQFKRFEGIAEDLKKAYTHFNDVILPAIERVIDDKLKSLGCLHESKRINTLEKRITTLEKEVEQLKKAV